MVPSESNFIAYTANGSTTVFAYNFIIHNDEHLVVKVEDEEGNSVTQVLDDDYTVSGVDDDSGGNVTFSSAPDSNSIVSIERIVPLTQETDLINNGGLPDESVEKSLDYPMMAVQQLNRRIDLIEDELDAVQDLITIPANGLNYRFFNGTLQIKHPGLGTYYALTVVGGVGSESLALTEGSLAMNYRISGQNLQLLNPGTGLYHTLIITGTVGAESLEIAAGEL